MTLKHALTTLAAGVALVVAPSAVATAAPAAPPADAASTAAAPTAEATAAPFLKLWSAAWMGRATSFTEAESVGLARRTNVIAAMSRMFSPYVPAMKAANPNVKLLSYVNATFGDRGYAESMYAHNSAGQRIRAVEWPDTYLMNLSNPLWADTVLASCQRLMASSSYDGCFLDVLGSGPITSRGYLTSMPVTGGKQWTANQWIGWTTTIASTVRTRLAGKPVMGNGLGSGVRYFDTAQDPRPLVGALDAVEPELFLRTPSDSISSYPTETRWKQNVDMIVDSQNRNGATMSMTKVWVNATTAQKNAWHRYTLASFMLGTNGSSLFSFLGEREPQSPLMTHPYDQVDVGTATGAYTRSGNAYVRGYTGGLAVVNPTKTPVTINLTGAYVTLDGTRVSGAVTLPASSGDVLKAA